MLDRMGRTVRIGTRGSELALWQAHRVHELLRAAAPATEFEIEIIETRGDQDATRALYRPSPLADPLADRADFNEIGLFTKKIEEALLDHRIDIAVHSLKDLPTTSPEGLVISAIPEREAVQDAWIARDGSTWETIRKAARVGTSSLRRRAELLLVRNDLDFRDIRGNVPRRLELLEAGEYDAIILAVAGLSRLGRLPASAVILPIDPFLPAPGQGAMAVQTRTDDPEVFGYAQRIDRLPLAVATTAERAFLQALEGGCQTPLGAYAVLEDHRLTLHGVVVAPDGSGSVRGEKATKLTTLADRERALSEAKKLGEALAEDFLTRGADTILGQR